MANGHCFCCCRRDSPRRLADCLPAALLVSAAWAGLCGRIAGAALTTCGGGWHGYARTLSPTALAASDASGGPSALQLLLLVRLLLAARALRVPAGGRPRRLRRKRRGFRRARRGLRGQGGPTRSAAIGTSILRVQRRSTKCCSALPLTALLRCAELSLCNGSLAVSPSSLCLSVPPSSSLPAPFPRPASRRSLPLSPSVCPWPICSSLFFAQFQRLSEPVSSETGGMRTAG